MNQTKFVAELSKLNPRSTFLAIRGYRNQFAEVADYSIIFHISYRNALRRSLNILRHFQCQTHLQSIAKRQVMDGYQASLDRMARTPIEDIDDSYTRFFDNKGRYVKGVKLHTSTKTLHLYGFISHKRVLSPGQYPADTRQLLTIVKDNLRRLCPVSRFRQFRILPNQVNRIVVEKLSLLPPSL